MNMSFRNLNGLMLVVHGEQPPSDDEWSYYVKTFGDEKPTAALVSTAGGGPNAAQREQLNRVVGKTPTAVLTDKSMMRGIITAFNWLGAVKMRAFASTSLGDALQYLGFVEQESQVRDELEKMRVACEGPHSKSAVR